MKIDVALENGSQLDDQEIDAYEKKLGVKFPDDYRRFVSEWNGAVVQGNIFAVGDDNDSGVNRFIPLEQIAKIREGIENLSPTRIPIARAEGGNFVCLDTSENYGLYFWDHEWPDDDRRVAGSFEKFLELLSPFGPGDVTVEDNDQSTGWIDPDFLESLKNK